MFFVFIICEFCVWWMLFYVFFDVLVSFNFGFVIGNIEEKFF